MTAYARSRAPWPHLEAAASGAEALAAASRESPDLASRISSCPTWIPFELCLLAAGIRTVIALTSLADSHDGVAALEAGCDQYVHLPGR